MSIEEIRNDIKTVDMELIKLLAKRMELVGFILDEKKRHGLPINDSLQNDQVLKRSMERAIELGLDTGAVKEIFQLIIQMSIDKQHELSGSSKQ
ncbi:MAG TPA: chorismate mutase [Methanocellaceae archaeon]